MEGTGSAGPLPIPTSYQVLHKLKHWDECQTRALNNRKEESTRLARKDLMFMLRTLRHSEPNFRHDPTYDPRLHNESAARVNRFFAAEPSYMNEWRRMGFQVLINPKIRVSNASTRAASELPERQLKPKWSNLSNMHVRWLAARTTVDILAELGLPCAIFGSMACKLYGNERLPNDVDILVLPPPDRTSITQEEIKALIVEHALTDYHFVLKPSLNPQATYKVLHFIAKPRPSISSGDFAPMALRDTTNDDDDAISQEFTPTSTHVPRRYSSKVDILLPGIMNLPALPTSIITYQYSLPLVPFPILILQKLQGWADHRAATEARYRAKIGVDVRDLEWCLSSKIVQRLLSRYKNNKNPKEPWKEMWSDRRMFSEEFEELSKERVGEFCKLYEGLTGAWGNIGFDV